MDRGARLRLTAGRQARRWQHVGPRSYTRRMTHPLDNPVWSVLHHDQAPLALVHGNVRRFPPDIGPFVAMAGPATATLFDIEALVAPGETVDFVAVLPEVVAGHPDWQVDARESVLQMVCDAVPDLPAGPVISELGRAHDEAMFALTRMVYPGYFRPRTPILGRYFGIWVDGILAAMAGERMRCAPWQEISAVCTHPQHLGKGHAARLVAHLVALILARGERPFLHVSAQNRRALALYERLGFTVRADIGLWLSTRLR